MNRLLGLPKGRMAVSLLMSLREKRSQTVVTERGTVMFQEGKESVEMPFLDPMQELPEGTPVYVWFHRGGFVCDDCESVAQAEDNERQIAQRVAAVRQDIARARELREQRHAQAKKEAAERGEAEQQAPDSVTAPFSIY